MKTARYCLSVVLAAAVFPLSAQQLTSIQPRIISAAPPALAPELHRKVMSGGLLTRIARKTGEAAVRGVTADNSFITVAIYTTTYPTPAFLGQLEALGVRATPSSWIPPMANHPFGFFLALLPTDRLADVLAIADVKRIDTAEREAVPHNNHAAAAIKADLAWADNWTGTGVKIGVLDSGLDDRMAASELPTPIVKKDYSNYPASIDTTVRNTYTPHGTHVVGSVLGRGGWSASNTGNGGGSYKGMAPNADLVFLKIGSDANGSATDAAIAGAIMAAVDLFDVKIISMSYGGWDTYHDGSDMKCQAVDYAYEHGAACFIAAGNDAADGHHMSGNANAHDTTGFIEITVTNARTNTDYLWMNLVWRDGAAHNGLKLLYYNSKKTLLSSTRTAPTESPRGTESEDSYYDYFVPRDNSTFYLRVVNPSSVAQPFHIFFNALFTNVVFAAPDPNTTIGSPALADHAFAVGAYTSRVNWTASDGLSYSYVQSTALSDIAYFSSRGPRIDGIVKPDITAPGSAVISLRDRDLLTKSDASWVDNDGVSSGPANYYVMEGTSMATPVAAGAAALLAQHSPLATPQLIYDAIILNSIVDGFTGSVPNSTWGYGRLDVNAAVNNIPLPVELTSFSATSKGNVVTLSWRTAGEVNNYGFEIEKRPVVRVAGTGARNITGAQEWARVGFMAGNGTSGAPHDYSFTDRTSASGTFAFRLKQIDKDGKCEYSSEVEVLAGAAPMEYSLGANYPNPFNPATRFQFSIGADERVHVAVYDLLGRRVADLLNEPVPAGRYTVEWNAAASASGIYFYRIDAGKFSAVRKFILQK